MSWTFTPGEQLDYRAGAEVTVINDVLDPEILSEARAEAENLHVHGKHFRTNRSWGQRLCRNSAPVLVTNISNDTINSELERVVRGLGMEVAESLYQIWTPGSYIPWHDDGYHKGALTVYVSAPLW